MTELPMLDMTVVEAIKKLMGNIRNDVNQYDSMDDIADLVFDHTLAGKKAYKPLLQSVCDLLIEKGYAQTSDFFVKHWHLRDQ